MEQPETSPESDTAPPAKVELPDPKMAVPIPQQYRLPFMGKLDTPTSVPSPAQRLANLDRLQKRRRRRGFLVGLLVGQLLIIALDLGGEYFLKTHPRVTLRTSLPVASVVFLGMAAGAAVMLAAVGVIYGAMGVRGFFSRKPVAAAGRGIARIFLTTMTLGVTLGIILGTAWFMIPRHQWRDTVRYAKDRGTEAVKGSKETIKGWLAPGAKQ